MKHTAFIYENETHEVSAVVTGSVEDIQNELVWYDTDRYSVTYLSSSLDLVFNEKTVTVDL
jgi:hypothetical protein